MIHQPGLRSRALLAVVTVVALAGCPKAVETPLTFATADPRIEIPILVQGRAMADVTLPEASRGSDAGALTYSLSPTIPGLMFDAAARVLSGTPTEAGTYAMTYTATDARNKTASLSFTVTIVDRLSFGSLMLPDVSLAQDSAVSGVTLPPAVGGTGTLTYRLTPMVPGLTFDATTRVLSGMPTTPGIYPMTYDVTDSAQATASLSFAIAVVGFGRTTLNDVSYDQDSTIERLNFPEATGRNLTYSLMPAVPGLTFDAVTRELSGIPTKAGMYSLTYTVTDAQGTTASLYFTVSVLSSFRGTWTSEEHEWWEDDESLGTFQETLTFTKERYILYRAHYRHDGTFADSWAVSGTWTSSGNTVTRVWLDDDETPARLISVSKNYVWGDDARDLLLMHPWTDDWEQPIGYNLEAYRRVANPLPSIFGVWRSTGEWDDGFTLRINADGTVSFDNESPGEGTSTLTATWEFDEDNYFLNLSDVAETWTPLDGLPEASDAPDAKRFAIAPTDSSNELIISPYWNETEITGTEDYREYGDYWIKLGRESRSAKK